jgi:membrane associated rhomboid family serine protease
MVLPLADDNTDRRITPFVNYALIAANVVVFVFLQQLGNDQTFTNAFSAVPYRIVTGDDRPTEPREIVDERGRPIRDRDGEPLVMPGLPATPISVYITLFTSMFLHGGIMHILGNMLFLYIFGDNIEDTLGHGRYFVFYLVCGLLSSLAYVLTTVALSGIDSEEALTPSLGASGAISGVLGGYILLFPQRRVLVLLLRILMWVPAWVAIGIWFGFQLISWLGSLNGAQSGVAYAAHVGGFAAGLALIKPFMIGIDERQSVWGESEGRGARDAWRQ